MRKTHDVSSYVNSVFAPARVSMCVCVGLLVGLLVVLFLFNFRLLFVCLCFG